MKGSADNEKKLNIEGIAGDERENVM